MLRYFENYNESSFTRQLSRNISRASKHVVPTSQIIMYQIFEINCLTLRVALSWQICNCA
jgi:hypothetical protein